MIKQSNESNAVKNHELSAFFPSALPWYMERGVIRPVELKGPQERKHSLFPEEAPGEDRIASKQIIHFVGISIFIKKNPRISLRNMYHVYIGPDMKHNNTKTFGGP